MDINTGYKLIAVASLCYATFSCSSPVHSNTDPEILARLEALQATVDSLAINLGEVHSAVQAAPAGQRACTVQEVIDQNLTACDPTQLPAGVATSSTYCIDQGRSGQLGTSFKIEPGFEIEIGGGWPNAIWGKLTGKAIIPPVIPVGPAAIPLPNEIHAGGEVSLGRGLSICVDVPISTLDPDQVAQIHDLVRGVNDGGKYLRRAGRVLNYAAVRTPVASPSFAGGSAYDYSKPLFEDTDDSFDIADAAIDRLIDGEFLQPQNGLLLFQDPIFQDLIMSLDVPVPAIDTINDPDRILGIFNTIGQNNIAITCQTMGITAESRARFPALANQCDRFAIYPDISRALNSANTLVNVQNSLSSLRSWMCENISLGFFTSC